MANKIFLSLVFTSLLVSSLCLITLCNAADDEHEFSYQDSSPDGPKRWGTLTAKWKPCSNGEIQSPIDIDTKKAKDQESDLKKDYKDASAKIVNKGHNLVVQWQGDAGGIEINGSTYKLVQCHWHTPSEHTIDGKRYDAELHFVHSNDKDQLAVIGVLYTVGEADPFIENMKDKIKGVTTNGNDVGKLSAKSTTSGPTKYFRYGGSLTTPPCSEGVIWTVTEKVQTISKDQIILLQEPLDHEYHENARPVQELNGRTVTQFEDKESSGGKEDSGAASSASSIPMLSSYGISILAQFKYETYETENLTYMIAFKADESKNTEETKHFDYIQGGPSGPQIWGSINPSWKICGDGKLQSPINIDATHAPVKPGDLKKAYKHAPAKLVNTGHGISMEWTGDAGGIEVGGIAYKLVQGHWHTPSEHTINGKRFDAELHLVHRNDKEEIAVIGIFHTIGAPDPLIGNLTEKIKNLGDHMEIDLGKVCARVIKCGSRRNYRYIGSLTTPPCKEQVIWTVTERVRPISQDQINLLKGRLGPQYSENARPLQQLGGRHVWRFDMPEEKE
ncbi:alpha carbonic anhydrase 3 [Artemisia annua]|uniref:Carbonic anhydrase n=1 Tax=Artemisia annua TaxID=35608 RepID=A0A2U1MD16_ARTAN|nr:alpha carbonic anhydrase 3 [Artemisia annua]